MPDDAYDIDLLDRGRAHGIRGNTLTQIADIEMRVQTADFGAAKSTAAAVQSLVATPQPTGNSLR